MIHNNFRTRVFSYILKIKVFRYRLRKKSTLKTIQLFQLEITVILASVLSETNPLTHYNSCSEDFRLKTYIKINRNVFHYTVIYIIKCIAYNTMFSL